MCVCVNTSDDFIQMLFTDEIRINATEMDVKLSLCEF